ncbi:hypothetical protein JCM1841_005515 [Sporobolomyces salmonicolor]
MVSSAVFLAAILVPSASFLIVIIWTICIYLKIRSLPHLQRPAYPPPTLLATVQHSDCPSSVSPPSPDYLPSGPAPLCPNLPSPRPSPHPHPPAPPPPPPAPAQPAEPSVAPSRFSIATTLTPSGFRILVRNFSRPNSGGTSNSGSSGLRSRPGTSEWEEKTRSKPEKARKVKRQFGVGFGEEEDREGESVVGGVETAHGVDAGLRKRSMTWTAEELEQVAMRAGPPQCPAPDPAQTLPLRRGRGPGRPLPPGAGYVDEGRMLAPQASTDEMAWTSSEKNAVAGSSQGSCAMLFVGIEDCGTQKDEDEDEERLTWIEGRCAAVAEGRSNKSYPSTYRINHGHSMPHLSLGTRAEVMARSSSPALASGNLSANYETDFDHTSFAPLPSSTNTSPISYQSSSSQFVADRPDAVRPFDAAAPSQPRDTRNPSPSAPSPAGLGHSRSPYISAHPSQTLPTLPFNSLTSSQAFDELEHYAASRSTRPLSQHVDAPCPESRTRRSLLSHWRSTTYFPADPPKELLDVQREREAILAATQPISWMARQGSSGTLPEAIVTGARLSDVHSVREGVSAEEMKVGGITRRGEEQALRGTRGSSLLILRLCASAPSSLFQLHSPPHQFTSLGPVLSMHSGVHLLLILATFSWLLASLSDHAAAAAPALAVDRRQAPGDRNRLDVGEITAPASPRLGARTGGRTEAGGAGQGETGTRRRRKRCYYVGTFFHRIDCNAAADSTSVPYSQGRGTPGASPPGASPSR